MQQPHRDMHGKICLVAGGTAGIGKATALGLAKLGATVVVAARNDAEGNAVAAEIAQESGNQSVSFIHIDLGSLVSMRQFVQDFTARYGRLDVLVHSAHVYIKERHVNDEGLEPIFTVTYLSAFYLSNLLVPLPKAGAPSRIVIVADDIKLISKVKLELDNLQGEQHWDPLKVHNGAKLALFYFAHEMASRLEGTGVTINALYPGHVDTGIKGDTPWFVPFVYPIFKHLGVLEKPEEGAETPIYLAVSPDVEGVTGGYYRHSAAAKATWDTYDEATNKGVWEASARLTGLDA